MVTNERIEIREALPDDAAGIARVRVQTWRDAYAGIVPDAHLASLDEERETRTMRTWLVEAPHPTFVLVAVNAGEVCGYALGGRERGTNPDFDGELWAIYILRPYQHQGIGRRLVKETATRLLAQGCRSMIVWVLAANPYRRFYECLGGEEVAGKEIDIGGTPLREVAYGWRDISAQLQ